MVLNRRYEVNNLNQIDDLTTYIDPQKYIEIFADTDLTSQNFWVQTVVQAVVVGVLSFVLSIVICANFKVSSSNTATTHSGNVIGNLKKTAYLADSTAQFD